MNIFVLDDNVDQCARYHCDKHVAKMVLESTQILCTALNKKGFDTPYHSTHVRHPCVLWVEESHDNFLWLVRLAHALNDEFCWRYNRTDEHASISVLRKIEHRKYLSRGLTEFPQVMPEQYKVPGDAVTAYRNLYIGEKARFATWKGRDVPEWFVEGMKQVS